MQATDARKSFPCFDEPAMKAYFFITLRHDVDKVALSNGAAVGQFDSWDHEQYLTCQPVCKYRINFILKIAYNWS